MRREFARGARLKARAMRRELKRGKSLNPGEAKDMSEWEKSSPE